MLTVVLFMPLGAICDKFDNAFLRWFGVRGLMLMRVDECQWMLIVLVQNFFCCFYWWWSMIVPELAESRVSKSISVQIVCSSPTWVSLVNHLFTTSPHISALRIGRISFFCCMACWVLFGSSSEKTLQHSHKTHPKPPNHQPAQKWYLPTKNNPRNLGLRLIMP